MVGKLFVLAMDTAQVKSLYVWYFLKIRIYWSAEFQLKVGSVNKATDDTLNLVWGPEVNKLNRSPLIVSRYH